MPARGAATLACSYVSCRHGMPGDLNSPEALRSVFNTSRRQNRSCDPCRRSKRRCVVLSNSDGVPDAICANCKRLKRQCTFEFAIAQSSSLSHKRPKFRHEGHSRSTTQDVSHESDFETTIDAVAGSTSNQFDAASVADQDMLATWLNLDCFDEVVADSFISFPPDNESSNLSSTSHSDNRGLDERRSTNQVAATTRQLNRLHEGQNSGSIGVRPVVGLSFNSPIYLLNSGIDANVFGDRLARIYEAIATASASRFLDYDCNLYATGSRYRLGDSDSGSSRGSTPAKSAMGPTAITPRYSIPAPPDQNTAHDISLLGSVRFLDHLSGLYGNRLDYAARRKSDEVFKAVLRAFSMQWLSSPTSSAERPTNDQRSRTPNPGDSGCDSSLNAFIDAWVRARSLLQDAHHVRSFRVVFATLMFVGIVTPTKIIEREGVISNHFLDTALQKLRYLDGLVTQYCSNLGPSSTYGALAEASLSIIRWTAYIRDTGAALAMDRQCKLPDLWGSTKGQRH
jgi:hypothetical protein